MNGGERLATGCVYDAGMAIFVGRERELQALDERLDEALAIGGKGA